jgi:hypothetical protein
MKLLNVPIAVRYNWYVHSVKQSKKGVGQIISNTKHVMDVFRTDLTPKYQNTELQIFQLWESNFYVLKII